MMGSGFRMARLPEFDDALVVKSRKKVLGC